MSREATKVPKHIGIIPDGNRRFSRRLMMKPWKGHEWGAKKVKEILEWSRDAGAKEITLYTFSIENFDRPKEEFDYLMELFVKEFDRLKDDEELKKHDVRVNVIGRLYLFPQAVQDRIKEVMEVTKDHKTFIVNFAMAYGGRAEVVDATKRIAEQIKAGTLDVEAINEECFSRNLYFEDEPDLIIRTGGEMRTSNFLPYQGAYSEWIFLDKMWPEFEKKDFEACIAEYQSRQRRFGK
ncbi:MAG: polyprenyl diphosphate synthase [archaeon]